MKLQTDIQNRHMTQTIVYTEALL